MDLCRYYTTVSQVKHPLARPWWDVDVITDKLLQKCSVSDTHRSWLLQQIFKINNVKALNSLINSFLLDTAMRIQIENLDLLIG